VTDKRLEELAAGLAERKAEREKAQAALDVARRAEVAANQTIRDHLKVTYNVDPWRL
jgi:hypothetical protein